MRLFENIRYELGMLYFRLFGKEKDIPKGPYCYTIKDVEYRKSDGCPIIHVKNCKYNKRNKREEDNLSSRCSLFGCEVIDSCKSCDLNWDDEEEE